MKRLLSVLLVLSLMLTLVPAATAEDTALKTGDRVEGFVVTGTSRFELVGADVTMFTHEKTGAQLMYIANDDTNRVFEITFRTPALNNRGTSHVFEHSTLDGSEKYPAKSLFFNLSYQTYNTYMNAATYNFMTTYPVASLSEAQLLAYADFYTDSCFNPILMQDDSIFREEAWRYSLDSADGELTLAGTVYSEMLGAMNQLSTARYNFMNAAFPGSTKSNESGGLPGQMMDLSYEEVCAYHDAYYHPSNSLTCLYGSFEDYTAFLRLLDGYFSQYDRKDIVITDEGYTPITGDVSVVNRYPLEAGAATDNAADIYYGIICGRTTEDEDFKLDLLTTLLNDSGSILGQAMLKHFPAAAYSCYVDTSAPETAVVFVLSGVNETDAPLFKHAVDLALTETAAQGFDPDSVAATAANVRMSTMLISENNSLGISLIPNLAYYWALSGDPEGYIRNIEALDHYVEYNENGTYCELISRLLLNDQPTALAVTVPAPGLKEEQDAALAQQLAEIKAGMSREQIDTIVAQTAALGIPESNDAAAGYVAQLQAVTVASLPEEARIYDITDITENGVRYMTADANTDGAARVDLLLDASGLSTEQLQTMQLFIDLLGDLDTSSHTRAQLTSMISRYLYGGIISAGLPDSDDEDGLHPYLRMCFTALDEDLDTGYDVLYELLFESDLTDVKRLQDSVSGLKTGLKKEIESSAYVINVYRALATASPAMAAYSYIHYLDHYDYLCDVAQRLESEPESVIAELETLREALRCRTGAVVLCAGNADSAAANRAAADRFLSRLEERTVTPVVHSFPTVSGSEALILSSPVQYNLIFAGYDDLALEGFSGALDAVAALVTDHYLLPMLRDQYGVYSVMHAFTQDGVYIETYRDTNITQTFDVYDALPAAIAQLDLSQEDIDNYILSSYSGYAMSAGELSGGESALLNLLNGDEQENILRYMHELKSITAESFKAYAQHYAELMEKGLRLTAGSASAIKSHADLYETIRDPFGAADAVVPKDLESNSVYAGASSYCRDFGLMKEEREDWFGVDSPATLGDLAVCMYAMLGGGDDPQEALDFWANYGLMEGSVDDTVTRQELARLCADYLTLLMAEIDAEAPQGYPDADRISEEAAVAFGYALDNGYMLPAEDGTLSPDAPATRGMAALYFKGLMSA